MIKIFLIFLLISCSSVNEKEEVASSQNVENNQNQVDLSEMKTLCLKSKKIHEKAKGCFYSDIKKSYFLEKNLNSKLKSNKGLNNMAVLQARLGHKFLSKNILERIRAPKDDLIKVNKSIVRHWSGQEVSYEGTEKYSFEYLNLLENNNEKMSFEKLNKMEALNLALIFIKKGKVELYERLKKERSSFFTPDILENLEFKPIYSKVRFK